MKNDVFITGTSCYFPINLFPMKIWKIFWD